MTFRPQRVGRVTPGGRAAYSRVRLPGSALHRVVYVVLFSGTVASAAAVWLLSLMGSEQPLFSCTWLPLSAAVPALVVLTSVAELVAVRLRYGEHVEELALIEAVVLMTALLLPPVTALVVSGSGVFASGLIRRRQVVKTLFNLGTHLTSTAAMILAIRWIGGDAQGFSPRLVVGLLIGTAAYALINLVALSAVFGIVRESRPIDFMRGEARLSALMVVGTTALGSTAVAMMLYAPVLLPFSVLPAGALMYAYRAVLQEAEERSRSQQLLTFSHALAATLDRAEAVEAFLAVLRGAFTVDERLLLLSDGSVVGLAPTESENDPESLRELRILRDVPMTGAVVLDRGLPRGWRSAMLAPLEAEGRRMGTVVLGSRRKKAFVTRDRTLLSPIVNALAVALVNAERLAQVIAETGKLKAVVDKSSDGIVVLDGTGFVELWNPAVARLTGWSESDAQGASFASMLDARQLDGTVLDAFTQGRDLLTPSSPQATVELPILRPNREARIVRCAYTAIYDGDVPVRFVVIVHDLTRERQVDRLKADFIATVSHELRTPVTPIKGYADLLRRRGEEMTPQKRVQCLDTIVDRADHLARLVEDLLLASRMSDDDEPARRVDMVNGDLVALARRASEDFRGEGRRIRLDLPDAPVTVACDPTRAVQVLTNLVGNALKYSPADSPVAILVEERDGVGRFVVSDSGRGLPEEQLERIFEKFHRVEDPAVMTTSGTGLGLFIARSLARAMGGDITVRSVLGVGSTFTFVLPLDEGSADGDDAVPRGLEKLRRPVVTGA